MSLEPAHSPKAAVDGLFGLDHDGALCRRLEGGLWVAS